MGYFLWNMQVIIESFWYVYSNWWANIRIYAVKLIALYFILFFHESARREIAAFCEEVWY